MIECANVSKVYKNDGNETVALKNVSFRVDNNEFVAIMGPSGSGKSTLMNILGCLDMPTSGKYFLDGQDIAWLSDNKLAAIRNKKIGFVFQSFNLLPKISVLNNVMLPLVYSGVTSGVEREKMAKEALKKAAFPENFLNYYPNQLSGGMMQRVAIARALVNDPAVILADEPTGNLDTKTGEIILETFQQLHFQHGATIVLITHEPYVAEHAERVIFIKDGELVDDKKVNRRRIINAKFLK